MVLYSISPLTQSDITNTHTIIIIPAFEFKWLPWKCITNNLPKRPDRKRATENPLALCHSFVRRLHRMSSEKKKLCERWTLDYSRKKKSPARLQHNNQSMRRDWGTNETVDQLLSSTHISTFATLLVLIRILLEMCLWQGHYIFWMLLPTL